MSDLDQPAISKIVMPHFLFFEPRRRVLRMIDRDKTIVIWAVAIIDPGIRTRYLMEGKIGSGRKLRVICIYLAELENSGWRPSVALFLFKTALVLAGEAATPGNPAFSEKHRHGRANGTPGTAASPLE